MKSGLENLETKENPCRCPVLVHCSSAGRGWRCQVVPCLPRGAFSSAFTSAISPHGSTSQLSARSRVVTVRTSALGGGIEAASFVSKLSLSFDFLFFFSPGWERLVFPSPSLSQGKAALQFPRVSQLDQRAGTAEIIFWFFSLTFWFQAHLDPVKCQSY